MSLHKPDFLPSASHVGYPIVSGIMEAEAITLLRSFYERENFHAPDDKRKKKEQGVATIPVCIADEDAVPLRTPLA